MRNFSGVATKVYVVDLEKQQVLQGPINVRALQNEPLLKYQEKLAPLIGMDPKNIDLVIPKPTSSRPTFIQSKLVSLHNGISEKCCKIFVPSVGSKITAVTAVDVVDTFGYLNSFTVQLPDTSKGKILLSCPFLAYLRGGRG